MKNIIVISAIVLAAVGLGYAYHSSNTISVPSVTESSSSTPVTSTTSPKTYPETNTTPTTTKTTEGTFFCLPHKNTTGPQTMECAFGMKTAEGKNYALDLSAVNSQPIDLPTNGKKFSVVGTISPITTADGGSWQNYDVVEVINVKSYAEADSNTTPYVSSTGKTTLALNQALTIGSTTLSVHSVTQDSRCPSDVHCIQAGTVTIELYVTNKGGPSTNSTLQTGKILQTGNLLISLDDVTPQPLSTRRTSDSEYRFSFTIKNK
jgi:hypothetical protein